MPIIDAHAHIATWPTRPACKKNLLEGMDTHGVDVSIVSNADCSSFPGEVAVQCGSLSAEEGLREALEFAKSNPGRIYAAVWFKPLVEPTPSKELVRLIEENRSLVVALKLHPFCEQVSPCDPRLEPYYELAAGLNLPILCHTALDFHSSIGELVKAAKDHPHLRFVAAHLELGSDHAYSIDAIADIPNIYADTAWVDADNAKKALETLGLRRVFFGTDAPIDGAATLSNPLYLAYFQNEMGLDEEQYEALMWKSSSEFYGIPFEK